MEELCEFTYNHDHWTPFGVTIVHAAAVIVIHDIYRRGQLYSKLSANARRYTHDSK